MEEASKQKACPGGAGSAGDCGQEETRTDIVDDRVIEAEFRRLPVSG